jgi:hypothetical protein
MKWEYASHVYEKNPKDHNNNNEGSEHRLGWALETRGFWTDFCPKVSQETDT